MTPIMKKYEQELKHPVRALALGDMLRTTLIQVRKTFEVCVAATPRLPCPAGCAQ